MAFSTSPGGVLAQAELGHLVHEFGVEEALLARLGLAGSASRAWMLCWSKGLVVDTGGTKRDRGHAEEGERQPTGLWTA